MQTCGLLRNHSGTCGDPKGPPGVHESSLIRLDRVDVPFCQEKVVLWCGIRRKVTSRCAKIVNKRTCRGRVDVQSGLKKTTCDVELEVK